MPWLVGGVVVAMTIAAVVGLIRRRVVLVTVSGISMEPTFVDGDRVLARRTRLADLRRGQVVVIEKPDASGAWPDAPPQRSARSREWMIKRIAALPGDPWPTTIPRPPCSAVGGAPGERVPTGQLVVLGDRPGGSFDSRWFGYCPADRLLGVVVRTMPQERRRTGRPGS